jgi:hypothetical protein
MFLQTFQSRRTRRETDEALVARLTAIFWEAHRPKMLAIIDRLEHDFERTKHLTDSDDEQLKESVRAGIRAIFEAYPFKVTF